MRHSNLVARCICGISVLTAVSSCKKLDEKPNILFLLADDQRADGLGCAGNQYIRTPNIDRLASAGMQFKNCYVMGGHHGAISAPSRAMLLSGKYLYNVYDKLLNVRTMPMHFADNGYKTFGTGKWHSEKKAFEDSFQSATNVFLGGMADHFNIAVADMGTDRKLGTPVKKGFSTDVFTGSAMEFIESYSRGDKKAPFFCYLAFTVPHDPYSPRPDYIDRYNPDSLALPGNFMPLHPFVFDDLLVRDENLLPWPRPAEKVKEVLADYYALITHLDENIGKIIKVLKDNGLYENTIIVYAADNGLAIGSHGLLGKQNLYEHSTKVPLIISGPGIPQGKISDALVYLLDLYPTLAELCHLSAPENVDGKSLVSVISGESDGVRSSLFTAYRNTVRAVRTGEWKLIRYPKRNFNQLFNLVSDPLEMNNLSGKEMYLPKENELLDLMKEWQGEVNDTVSLTSSEILSLQYDHTKLVRKADQWQPEYTLKKYFGKN